MEDNTEHIKPFIPDDVYLPLTAYEYYELKSFLPTIGVYLQESQASYVWNMYRKIDGNNESQPCLCAISAGLWIKAVNYLNDWVKSKP